MLTEYTKNAEYTMARSRGMLYYARIKKEGNGRWQMEQKDAYGAWTPVNVFSTLTAAKAYFERRLELGLAL